MKSWHNKEIRARRAAEDRGFVACDANVLFRANCPNIDLIVFAKNAASYVQVKSSQNPAASDTVVIDGSPWTHDQLRNGAPIFNKHDGFKASLILVVDTRKTGETEYYIAPPEELERLVLPLARAFADRPKRDGTALCVPKSLNRNEVVMKSAQDGVRTYDAGSLNRTRDGRILVQRPMRSNSVVIGRIVFQIPAQMFLAQNNDVVQTFPPDRSDQPFGKAILPR